MCNLFSLYCKIICIHKLKTGIDITAIFLNLQNLLSHGVKFIFSQLIKNASSSTSHE